MLEISVSVTQDTSVAEWMTAFGTVGAVVVALLLGLLGLVVPAVRAWWRRPVLEIDYQLGEPYCRDVPIMPGLVPSRWVRVKVSNGGRGTAKRCKGKVIAVYAADGSLREDRDAMLLHWAGMPLEQGLEPLDLAREEHQLLDVVHARSDRRDAALIVADPTPAGFAKELEAGQVHKVRLAVYADNAEPVTAAFVITFDGDISSLKMQPATSWRIDPADRSPAQTRDVGT
jgi:hypothetical protein